jgi:molybdopterin synthase sulfur carrier subunit
MPLKLVFLGRLEDAAGVAAREVPLAASVEEVLDSLEPGLAATLREPRVRRAVNGALLRDGDVPMLRDGDEIAFLPPVSGG